jgi:hypothetical protein
MKKQMPVRFGIALGVLLGILNLLGTALAPLAEDTPLLVGGLLGAIISLLGIIGFMARRSGTSLGQAVVDGAMAGAVTFSIFLIASIVRVNLFLDVIRYRSDWQNLVADFQHSGSQSLRAYANLVYMKSIFLIPMVGVIAGSIGGAIGGLLGGIGRRRIAC